MENMQHVTLYTVYDIIYFPSTLSQFICLSLQYPSARPITFA